MTRWLAVAGSRIVGDIVCRDVERDVTAAIDAGWGIVSGGSTGVDTVAMRVAYEQSAPQRIFLPIRLDDFCVALTERAAAGKHRVDDVRETIQLLYQVRDAEPSSICDDTPFSAVDEESFWARNRRLLDVADELLAYIVADSVGTQYTIDQAVQRSLPIKVRRYDATNT